MRSRGGNTRRGRKSKKDNFRSQLERDFARNLKQRKADFGYECDKISYVKEHTYNPDFSLLKEDGTIMYIETKGYFPKSDMSKMRAVKKCNPDLDIRIIFWDSSKKNKGTVSNYGEWCKRNGFKFADKTLPAQWRRELASNKIKAV